MLYVHLPFCRVHCTYCPFAVTTDLKLERAYFRALLTELETRVPADAKLTSSYVGGGTPSRSSEESLVSLFSAIARRRIVSGAEVTFEANPEDISSEAVERWKAHGVNRLSIGVQSLHDAELLPLGRIHGASVAMDAVRTAVSAGIRITTDVILGLPRQTAESFRATLRGLVNAGVGHISLYMLDLEEGTTLQRQVALGKVDLPDEGLVADLYLEAIEFLDGHGLRQYEISNFAKAGDESRHNIGYWERRPYFGLGLGAHSFDGAMRSANSRSVPEYVDLVERNGNAIVFREELTPVEEKRERIFLSLRQKKGIEYSELLKLCGEEAVEWCERGVEQQWLERHGERVAFTAKGFLLSNEYLSQLF